MNSERPVLVAAPAYAERMAVGSTFKHRCGTCKQVVMVAPSGQSFLKRYPDAEIRCYRCWVASRSAANMRLAGDPGTVANEVRTAVPNLYRGRN